MKINKGTRIPIGALASVSLAVTISTGAGAATATPRPAAVSHTAYVAIDGRHRSWVLPVNTTTGRPGRRIPLSTGFVGDMVASPNGRFVYVQGSHLVKSGPLFVISTASNTVVAAIKVPSTSCEHLGIAPDGRTVYDVCGDKVFAVDTTTNKITATIRARGDLPQAIAITPDSKKAYVLFSNRKSVTVIPINLVAHLAGRPIRIFSDPSFGSDLSYMAMTPNGKTLYVDAPLESGIVPVNTATNTVGKTIRPRGRALGQILITPNGRTAYAICYTDRGDCPPPDDIIPVDLTTGTEETPVSGGFDPEQIAITPDGKTVYVANTGAVNGGGNVIPISTATNTRGKHISLGKPANPLFVYASPDGKTVYAAGYTSPGWLIPISTATNKPGKRIDLYGAIQCMAFTGQSDAPQPFCGSVG